MKRYDIVALGEVLIDFTFAGTNDDGKKLYEENPGGAPANCVCAAVKLGAEGAFIGMTGQDSFGDDIRVVLEGLHVDCSGMRRTAAQHTTLAFVSLDPRGERTFSFCRNPGADTQLSPADLDMQMLAATRILHVGSLSLTDEPSRAATMAAVEAAKKAGALISYDPNYRANLWRGHTDAIRLMKGMLPLADIVKVSEEELALLFGADVPYGSGAQQILAQGPSLVLITLGAKGVYYAASAKDGSRPACSGTLGVPDVPVADTTGAGDSFTGGLLYRLTRRPEPLVFTKAALEQDIAFANAVASICVTRRGAIPALPDLRETEAFLQAHR
ncbi:MAG TPA: carbohydrate kinase [Treponema sp.]|nr:carbohydrate kinase [Treponema sp.]